MDLAASAASDVRVPVHTKPPERLLPLAPAGPFVEPVAELEVLEEVASESWPAVVVPNPQCLGNEDRAVVAALNGDLVYGSNEDSPI